MDSRVSVHVAYCGNAADDARRLLEVAGAPQAGAESRLSSHHSNTDGTIHGEKAMRDNARAVLRWKGGK